MSEKSPESEAGPEQADKITRTVTMPVVSRNIEDLEMPGVWVEVDPDIAEDMGVFEEIAVSVEDVEDDGNGE